jgi:hypothetical protein
VFGGAKIDKKLEYSTIAMQILQESAVSGQKKMAGKWKNSVIDNI